MLTDFFANIGSWLKGILSQFKRSERPQTGCTAANATGNNNTINILNISVNSIIHPHHPSATSPIEAAARIAEAVSPILTIGDRHNPVSGPSTQANGQTPTPQRQSPVQDGSSSENDA